MLKLFSLCCMLSLFHHVKAMEKDSIILRAYLEKYGLVQTDPLIVIHINPDECEKYKLALTLFLKKTEHKGLEDHMIFLIEGLRVREAHFFMEHELNFPYKDHQLITDDKFGEVVSPENTTSVILISRGKIQSHYSIFEAADKFIIREEGPDYEIVLTDSILLKESVRPFSKVTRPLLLNDSTILFMNYRYNSLSVYALRTGKCQKEIKLTYAYGELFRQINPDSGALNFAMSGRSIISAYHMHELLFQNMAVHGNKVFVACTVMFASREGLKDTVLTSYPFLMLSDTGFENIRFVLIQTRGAGSYEVQANNNFFVKNDSEFIFNMRAPGDSISRAGHLYYLGEFHFSCRENKISFTKFAAPELPEYFRKMHLYYAYGMSDFCSYRQKIWSWFMQVLPVVRAIDSDEQFSLPDSSFRKITAGDWQQQKHLELSTAAMHALPDDRLACLLIRGGNYELLILDGKDKHILFQKNLPAVYFKGGRVVMTDKWIYVLNPEREDVYLYRFWFGTRKERNAMRTCGAPR